jgi:hypothetical protein
MMELSDLLRNAASDPPPTSIDMERLIAGERVSAVRRRWLAGGGAMVLVVAVTVGVTVAARPLGDASGPTVPSADPCAPYLTFPAGPGTAAPTDTPAEPAPTEPEDVALVRLSAALRDALAATLPDAQFVDPFSPCEPLRFRSGVVDSFRYYAVAGVTDADGFGGIEVMVGDQPTNPAGSWPEHTTLDDGTTVGWSAVEGTRHGADVRQHQVLIERLDGTAIMLIASNYRPPNYEITRQVPPATVEQLIAIGTEPDLTLYP